MEKKGVIVITGAGQGLGRAIAVLANTFGLSVALVGRTQSKLVAVKKEIIANKNKNTNISVHAVDLTDEKSTEVVIQKILKEHGKIAALINNAATWTGGKMISELSRKDIQSSLDLNFFSAFNATKSVLKTRKKNDEMSIVNIGATSSLQGWDGVSAFCIAKGALRSFSQSLARELGPEGVHVAHVIIDGLIGNGRTFRLNPKIQKSKFMKMESIAETVMHVALQEKSAWTFEIDLRPYNESW